MMLNAVFQLINVIDIQMASLKARVRRVTAWAVKLVYRIH